MRKIVLIIEPGKYSEGMTTGGLGSIDIGNKYEMLFCLFCIKISIDFIF